jgi:uncharacterized protein YraI
MLKKILYSLLFTSLLLTGLSVQGFQPATETVTVTARYLNVRQGPSTSTTILTIIRAGETYPVIGQSGTWWQIQVGNITGYISGRYVTVSDGSAATAVPVISNGTPCSTVIFFSSTPSDVCTGAINHTKAAFQSYQHGFMIWLADSGTIWVYIDAIPGFQPPWMDVPQSYYAGFPDATGSAPAGLVQPINGFGRVWANMTDNSSNKLKDRLGWATTSEVSYNATWQNLFRAMHTHTYISVADGRVVDSYDGLAGHYWSLN